MLIVFILKRVFFNLPNCRRLIFRNPPVAFILVFLFSAKNLRVIRPLVYVREKITRVFAEMVSKHYFSVVRARRATRAVLELGPPPGGGGAPSALKSLLPKQVLLGKTFIV